MCLRSRPGCSRRPQPPSPAVSCWTEPCIRSFYRRQFALKTGLTGQLCMDFMRDDRTGVYYPIECNPRIHTQCCTFLNDNRFGEAVLAEHFGKPLLPSPGQPPVFWLYNELFKLLPDALFNYGSASFLDTIWRIATEQEGDFDWEDPGPFFLRNHVQLPGLLLGTFLAGTPWKKLDFAIGKVVELNGD